MAKRLSKALREKCRWIGINVSNCENRYELKTKITKIAPVKYWKLYDFKNRKAILRIYLKDEKKWREILEQPDSEIYSVTTSGKINLVRLRMGLEKSKKDLK